MIKTEKSNIEQIAGDGNTALMYACMSELENVALELIKTGKSRPEQISNKGNTALILACNGNMSNVALELIKTGISKPGQASINGNTALIWACYNNMPTVALELINTGEANINQININKKDALFLAKQNNMIDVIKAIENIINKVYTYNILNKGFDMINQESHVIKDYLKENNNNVVFVINGKAFLSNKKNIEIMLDDKVHIKYACKRVGNADENGRNVYILDSNINQDITYFSMSPLIGMQIVVKYAEILNIVTNTLSSTLIGLESTNLILPGIMSEAFLMGRGGTSADHCQPNKETEVYKLVNIVPICEAINDAVEQIQEPIIQDNSVNIMYKNII